MVITANPPKFDKRQPSKGDYDAIVYIEGSEVVAEDSNGRKIASGVAGTDDSTVMNDVATLGGNICVASNLVFTDTVTLISNTKLWCDALSKITTADSSLQFFDIAGTIGSNLLLSSDVLIGASIISLIDASSLLAGDWIKISSNIAFSAEYATIYHGEIRQIESIAGNDITINGALWATYNTADAAKVQKISFKENIQVMLNIEGTSETSSNIGLSSTFTKNLDVSGKFVNTGDRAINILDTLDARISPSCYGQVRTGTGYGVCIGGASQFVTVLNGRFARNRHAVTSGGLVSSPGVPRFIDVLDNICRDSNAAAIDSHSVGDFVKYSRNTIIDAAMTEASYGYISVGAKTAAVNGNIFKGSNDRYAIMHRGPVIESLDTCDNDVFGVGGIYLSSNSLKRIVLSNNDFDGASSTRYGAYIRYLTGDFSLVGGTIKNYATSGSYALYLSDCVSRGVISNANIFNVNRGIWINNSTGVSVRNTYINSADYSIRELGTSNSNYAENNVVSTAISFIGASSKVRRNIGYPTDASGSSTGTGIEQTIAHGLAAIPVGCKAWITYKDAGGDYITEFVRFNATNIKVTLDAGIAYTWGIGEI